MGASANMLSSVYGGAYAPSKVYAEITGGMGIAPSVGGSITYYFTEQTDWIYGRANMEIITNPYQSVPWNPSPMM